MHGVVAPVALPRGWPHEVIDGRSTIGKMNLEVTTMSETTTTPKKKRAPAKKRAAKAKSAKTVHTSGKEKNRFALNIWVTAAQKKELKSQAKAKGTSIVGMLRHALKLPE